MCGFYPLCATIHCDASLRCCDIYWLRVSFCTWFFFVNRMAQKSVAGKRRAVLWNGIHHRIRWNGWFSAEREREKITTSIKSAIYFLMNLLSIRMLLSMYVLYVLFLYPLTSLQNFKKKKMFVLILETLFEGLVSVKAAKISCANMCEHPGHALNATFRLSIDQRLALSRFSSLRFFASSTFKFEAIFLPSFLHRSMI